MSRLRRPGARWRLLVHEWAGRTPGKREGTNGPAHHITPDPEFARKHPDTEHSRTHLIEGTEFDELVIERWLHVEQMDTRVWWMNIAGITVHATVDRDGRPTHVRVDGPGDYDDPVPGCTYELGWSRSEAGPTQPAAWSPPPPGDTREQLPDAMLALIRPEMPNYLSTACQTADCLTAALAEHPEHADEIQRWVDYLQQKRCRLNHKYTGILCQAGHHQHHTEEQP